MLYRVCVTNQYVTPTCLLCRIRCIMRNKVKDLKTTDISFHNSIDGLWDIGIGLVFLLSGFAFLFDAVAITVAFYFPIFLLIKGLKNKMTYPRIGFVNHKGMKTVTNKAIYLLLILGVLFFILGLFVYTKLVNQDISQNIIDSISNFAPIILGILLSLFIIFLGKSKKIQRFYYYSGIILLSFLAIRFVEWSNILPITLLSCGFIILLVGLITLIMFIPKYPRR